MGPVAIGRPPRVELPTPLQGRQSGALPSHPVPEPRAGSSMFGRGDRSGRSPTGLDRRVGCPRPRPSGVRDRPIAAFAPGVFEHSVATKRHQITEPRRLESSEVRANSSEAFGGRSHGRRFHLGNLGDLLPSLRRDRRLPQPTFLDDAESMSFWGNRSKASYNCLSELSGQRGATGPCHRYWGPAVNPTRSIRSSKCSRLWKSIKRRPWPRLRLSEI